ncbi:MAG: hypothetical protein ACYC4K_02815 [Thiobacillus sp.]
MADELGIDCLLDTSELPNPILGDAEILGGSELPPNVLGDNLKLDYEPLGELYE